MPTSQERLAVIKSQALARIEEITAAPKPSYDIDGQEVKWSEYLKQLQETVAWCNEQQRAEEPFEIRSIGFT